MRSRTSVAEQVGRRLAEVELPRAPRPLFGRRSMSEKIKALARHQTSIVMRAQRNNFIGYASSCRGLGIEGWALGLLTSEWVRIELDGNSVMRGPQEALPHLEPNIAAATEAWARMRAASRGTNGILKRLPDAEFEALAPLLQRVELRPKQVLEHCHLPVQFAYFIERGLISTTIGTSKDKTVETWLIGREGTTAIPAGAQGGRDLSYRRVVLIGGSALRIRIADLAQVLQRLDALRRLICENMVFVCWEASHVGACNAQHSLKQRVARWLLVACDRLGSDHLPLTHREIARVFGVRRAGISAALACFEDEGILRKTRGLIEILDPRGLQSKACDCSWKLRRPFQLETFL